MQRGLGLQLLELSKERGVLGALLDRDTLNRPTGHRGRSPERPNAQTEVGFTPVRRDRCRNGGMDRPDIPGRPLRESVTWLLAINLAIHNLTARLTLLDLMEQPAVLGLREDVEADLAEAVRTGLIHRLLPICCPSASDRGRPQPDRAVDLGWS
jgi:hypothetical protein